MILHSMKISKIKLERIKRFFEIFSCFNNFFDFEIFIEELMYIFESCFLQSESNKVDFLTSTS